ncbi:MAG: hypothetical protein H6686_05710 [Fibrobacteria bacterium]|nr:hypothetical protein [Fibrobacteria bacterium]
MIDSIWASRLVHSGWGLALYVVFQAWGVLSETSAPDAPSRRAAGANAFVLGQAMAIAGVVGISLLCGRTLFSTFQLHGLEVFALWAAGILALIEGVCALLEIPTLRERRPLEELDFAAGRDLILRHSPALFLALTASTSWLGPTNSTMVAGGCVLGWGMVQSASGPSSFKGLWMRRFAATGGIAMAAMLFRAAWKWS